jgi:hypothetical protein
MTARFSVKNSHIEDDLILILKKQTPTVKVITVRLKIFRFNIQHVRIFQQEGEGRSMKEGEGRGRDGRKERRKEARQAGRQAGRKEGEGRSRKEGKDGEGRGRDGRKEGRKDGRT